MNCFKRICIWLLFTAVYACAQSTPTPAYYTTANPPATPNQGCDTFAPILANTFVTPPILFLCDQITNTYASASGAGSGNVNPGTAGEVAWYALTGSAVSGNTNATLTTSGILTLNGISGQAGLLNLVDNTSVPANFPAANGVTILGPNATSSAALGIQLPSTPGVTPGFAIGGSTNIVVTFTNTSAAIAGVNNFPIGTQLVFANVGGGFPTAFNACAAVCYVISAGLSTSQFEVSATYGGSAIVANSAGTGTTTVTSNIIPLSFNPTVTFPFGINLNGGLLPAPETGTLLQISNAAGTLTGVEADAYAAQGNWSFVRRDGTPASPTALQSGELIGAIGAQGAFNSAGGISGTQALISMLVAGGSAWSSTNQGTALDFYTTPLNSTTLTEVARLGQAGGLTMPSSAVGGDEGAGTLNISTEYFLAGTPGRVFLTAPYSNATAGMTNVTGLAFAVNANTNYTATCNLYWSESATTAPLSIQFTGPAAPTAVRVSLVETLTAGSAPTFYSATANSFSTAIGATAGVTTGVGMPAQITIGLLNGATAGTVQLQAVPGGGAGTLSIETGSNCTLGL